NYKVSRYIAEGDTVVAVGSTSWRVRATGKDFETPKVDVVRFEDGKIVSFFEYYDTAKILAATTP
ncbi:MAG: nuclear transport factor 2 family protein, partial [Hyphomicrobiales bacterium]|nr:nuclear transport factor 2 family protein [Hyphomicrobiales bacterium]MCP4329718.1 nuclear transport factor 2 family protein [Alphaproteobacteria bacterium]